MGRSDGVWVDWERVVLADEDMVLEAVDDGNDTVKTWNGVMKGIQSRYRQKNLQ